MDILSSIVDFISIITTVFIIAFAVVPSFRALLMNHMQDADIKASEKRLRKVMGGKLWHYHISTNPPRHLQLEKNGTIKNGHSSTSKEDYMKWIVDGNHVIFLNTEGQENLRFEWNGSSNTLRLNAIRYDKNTNLGDQNAPYLVKPNIQIERENNDKKDQ